MTDRSPKLADLPCTTHAAEGSDWPGGFRCPIGRGFVEEKGGGQVLQDCHLHTR